MTERAAVHADAVRDLPGRVTAVHGARVRNDASMRDKEPGVRLASIHIYPMKAARAVDLDESAVEPWGLAGDRRWLLVDEDGRFVSQREEPIAGPGGSHPTLTRDDQHLGAQQPFNYGCSASPRPPPARTRTC